MDALAEDSQRGTILDADTLKNAKRWKPDGDTVEWCKMICQKNEMPPFGKKFRLRQDIGFEVLDN